MSSESLQQRLCLFGGTFNPVHRGHLAMAEAALNQFALDQIIWVPAGHPPHKPLLGGVTSEERLEMLRLTISGNPKFSLSLVDIDRSGPSYAIDTLSLVKAKNPDARWFWLIGQDSLVDLPSWFRANELISSCEWIVASRSGKQNELSSQLSDLEIQFGQRFWLLKDFSMNISSTAIREALKRGQSVEPWLLSPVSKFILSNKLYQSFGDL
jgi:nicotinate-nucleotide adenylyltransferase